MLHPIKALEHVIDEYSDYLRTEFRAKDPALREALERELNAPGFLAQEPFYQAHRPFRTGKNWRGLNIDTRLAKVMENRSKSEAAYLHQSNAIDELLSAEPNPVVITTGTGSGKTEGFLLPVIQNAFEDATRFKKSGLTAILIYPMNALANDQKQRIDDYLRESGIGGSIRVEQYDRRTPQSKRDEMRTNPPHILLTNYMMLEYLLVRPADRENIFANHRCRFLVLDEVHTYRGILGSNIALLIRRLKVHLRRAQQDWKIDVSDTERSKRFPSLIPIGTSATIKSLAEEGLSHDEMIRQRDEAVQKFFGDLTGYERDSIRVFGEELAEIRIPAEARYPENPEPINVHELDISNAETVRLALCKLAALPQDTPLETAVNSYKLLWDLNSWLIRKPMSISQIVMAIREEVSERANHSEESIRNEAEAALTIGAALPEDLPGALRLRAHRFIRGGWKFYRCVNPECGKLFPMGEERCSECDSPTAPLYLCRNCGADYLRFVGDPDDGLLRPSEKEDEGPEWLIYDHRRFQVNAIDDEDIEDGDDTEELRVRRGQQRVPSQIRRRPVLDGSFDPQSLQFSGIISDYPYQITLSPARSRCLCCGGTAGSRNVITPVTLGTSAAVKVIGEGLVDALADANRDRPGHDGKERLLIFSDSRQDAAHQARFIYFASRYDRMRQRLASILQNHGELSIQRTVELLADEAVNHHDNPYVPEETDWIPEEARNRIIAWEEAPLLDEISVNAGYRATVNNLGLVGVSYHQLNEYVNARGSQLAEHLSIGLPEFEYICHILLDDMRTLGALSRPLLQYHPSYTAYPAHFKAAEWERRMKQPQGFPLTPGGEIVTHLDKSEMPPGVKHHNVWRRQGTGGRGPRLERVLRHLCERFEGNQPDDQLMIDIIQFLRNGNFLIPCELFGARQRRNLLQVNSEVIRLGILTNDNRMKCDTCGEMRVFDQNHMPCPRCHGVLGILSDEIMREHRAVRRILHPTHNPLVAGEHTAQVTPDERAILEDNFKASPEVSTTNVLACSPTLEMGIDVGGLDAVTMRNVPPRPDNYAQRGGRAGRRSRIGLVVGYARSTPHDQYFYDKPREMISGEVPAPAFSLTNRDVLLRHLYSILFGHTEPGLAGRMVEYVSPEGAVKDDSVSELTVGLQSRINEAIDIAHDAWGNDIFQALNIDDSQIRDYLSELPARVQRVFEVTARQVIELRQALDHYAQSLERRHAGVRAGELIARLLGIPSDRRQDSHEADDRSAGYPLRRLAEFGLLPGYEFPSEPATLRLLGDDHEEDPITVVRRFGIGQFQPKARVFARRKRWQTRGLDVSSPWNQTGDVPNWNYRLCNECNLRYSANQPRCPRCGAMGPGQTMPAFEFAGFLAIRNESPVLDEEERYAARNLVSVYPQWNGDVVGRWTLANNWGLRLSRNEQVIWLNEGLPATPSDFDKGIRLLHREARGWPLCPTCGRILDINAPNGSQSSGRRNVARNRSVAGNNGHTSSCPRRGSSAQPIAIETEGNVEILRLILPLPHSENKKQWFSWGISLGYSILNGIQRLFTLDPAELDFELEGPWTAGNDNSKSDLLSLAFVDPNLGGSGYLERVADQFHLVALRSIEHLNHANCETACYRCLKTYRNQRYHDALTWPQVIPALDQLAGQQPLIRPLETGDLDDPGPWLEAYAAGVGSPLELKFLRLFEKHGFIPEKSVPVSPSDDIAPISVADFAVSDRRLAIYIDGASFHIGPNLRRDRYIRNRLRNGSPPWRVMELRASDLNREGEIISEILA